jgi:hypothetical protein
MFIFHYTKCSGAHAIKQWVPHDSHAETPSHLGANLTHSITAEMLFLQREEIAMFVVCVL